MFLKLLKPQPYREATITYAYLIRKGDKDNLINTRSSQWAQWIGSNVLPYGEEKQDIFPCLGSTHGIPLTCGSVPCKEWEPSFSWTSPTRSRTCAPFIGRSVLTTGLPGKILFIFYCKHNRYSLKKAGTTKKSIKKEMSPALLTFCYACWKNFPPIYR